MKEFWMVQGIYLLRLVLAAFCGILIGYERDSKLKMAGIRTHSIVALAAALMMVISKYGFQDVLNSNTSMDPSRVGASVVTAVSFLGAGVIFNRNQNIKGLTTAAGLWATVGVGLAIGSGMYVIGIVSAMMIILLQFLSHRNVPFAKSASVEEIVLRISSEQDLNAFINRVFHAKKIGIVSVKITREEEPYLRVKLAVSFPRDYQMEDLLQLMQEEKEIESIDI